MSGGWNPSVHLFSQSRGRLRFDEALAAFVPDVSVQAERSAGACRGLFSAAGCLAEGAEAGVEAARAAGFGAEPVAAPEVVEPAEAALLPAWLALGSRPAFRSRAFVDFQNDVTAKDLGLAVREGFRSIEHVKRYTTTGMGTDQGKTSNVNALAIVAGTLGTGISAVGTTTFRPPYTPTTFGAFAGPSRGDLFDPIRRTPSHAWAEAAGCGLRGCRHVEARPLFPTRRRGHARRRRPRVPPGPRQRRHLRRQHARKNRHPGPGRRGLPRSHLHQRLAEARRRPRPLRPDAGRGRHGLRRRRHDAHGPAPLPHDHDDGRGRARAGLARELAPDRVAGASLLLHLGHRAVGRGGAPGPACPRPARQSRRGHRPLPRGFSASGRARGHHPGRPLPRLPRQLHGRAGLRDQRALELRPCRLGGCRRGREKARCRRLRHRGDARAARREGLHRGRPGDRRHGDAHRPRHGLDRQQAQRSSWASARSPGPT